MSNEAPAPTALLTFAKQRLDAGEPVEARGALEQCLPIAQAQGNPALVVHALSMLASCHWRLMRTFDADAAYAQALRIADEQLAHDDPARIVVMMNCAAFLRSHGALAREQALRRTILPVLEGRPTYAQALGETRRSLQELETLPAVEQPLRQSLDDARRADMAGEASFESRVASFDTAQQHALALGDLLGRMGRHRERAATRRDGWIMRPDELWRSLTRANATTREHLLDEQRCRFNLFLQDTLRHPGAVGAQTALETLLWRRGIGLELHRCANRVARGDPQARQLLDTLRAARAEMAAAVWAMPPDAELRPDGRTQLLIEPLARQFDHASIEAQLFARMPPTSQRFVSRPADAGELAARIPEGGLLVEFWRCTWPQAPRPQAGYVALVLPAGRPDQAGVVPLGEAEELETLVLDYLSWLSGRGKSADLGGIDQVPRDPRRARELGHRIRARLLDPLGAWLARARHLLLVADGLLHRLPVAALPLEHGHVMDRWLVSHLRSSRDLFIDDEVREPCDRPLVMAGPSFDWPGRRTTADFRYGWLEGAAAEGDAVAKLLGVTPLADVHATKLALTTARSPEILHVATHGGMLPARPVIAELGPLNPFVWHDAGELRLRIPGLAMFGPRLGRLSGRQLPDQALRSVLALAGVNAWLAGDATPPEVGNGFVTASDIASMDLAGNRLTVLSACETGLGVVDVGEGVLGLASSFAVAGTETVVASLWEVDDPSTKELMLSFHQGILSGLGRAAALDAAQKRVQAAYPDDPMYWAPFICLGAPGPIRAERVDAVSKSMRTPA